jgi:hypothetical protein
MHARALFKQDRNSRKTFRNVNHSTYYFLSFFFCNRKFWREGDKGAKRIMGRVITIDRESERNRKGIQEKAGKEINLKTGERKERKN